MTRSSLRPDAEDTFYPNVMISAENTGSYSESKVQMALCPAFIQTSNSRSFEGCSEETILHAIRSVVATVVLRRDWAILEAMWRFRVKRKCYNERIIVFRTRVDRYVAHDLTSITKLSKQEVPGTTDTCLDHRSIGNLMLGFKSDFCGVVYIVHRLL